jgi:hypothetical protein
MFKKIIPILLFFGCSGSDFKNIQNESPFIAQSNQSVKIVSEDIIIENGETSPGTFQYYSLLNDTLLLGSSIQNPDKLSLFNLHSKAFIRNYLIDKRFFKSRTGAFFMLNDSLVLIKELSSYRLYVYDFQNYRETSLFDISLIKQEINGTIVPFDIPSFFRHGNPIGDPDINIFLPFQIPEPFIFKKGIGQLSTVAALHKNGNFQLLEADSSIYHQIIDGAYPEDLSYTYLEETDHYIFVNYPMDHFAYKYDKLTLKYLGKFPCCPRNPIEFPAPLSKASFKDRTEKWKFRITTPFYEPLKYHSKLKLYSRILHYPIEVDENSRISEDIDQKRISSILIFDEKFSFVQEYIVEGGLLGVYQSVPTSDGWLFGPCSSLYKSERKFIFNKKITFMR